ncbi:hypothetical protein DICPUDRAFT_78826 [Dictyostelium purpureum]|uniref:G-protein coupled receptors family 3 profile domain-containing protein n=1 Tax=Dictyostelium purpureum TaxID=5786 RepID=F0ZKP2_DICPU|nr:uncharacterized protein DICPUDRAFT_78826 [Dictyostelium purpureum]EGC35497.1 hypothetical protein DICPUDRAFT_78826 [Dictyostelium purpureum]|eukprot:XP_003287976.1 hypothetical protein DICPUDRAFT_78826 [Dictyostelium purpureum]
MKKLFIFVVVFLLFFINIINSQANKKCKISLLLSGDFNDMGYNFMMNDARIRTERILGVDSIYYVHLEESLDLARWAIEDSVNNQNANFIIVSSSIHTSLGFEYAKKYQDRDIYWFIRGRSRPAEDGLDKVTVFSFNSYVLHYALGYFSGLMSKTGVVGFVAPGPQVQTVSTDNSYYLGARAANSSIKFVNIYTGSWLNPEVAYKASEFLISNGADYIGMSQDDMSVQHALIDHGSMGLGATGYPNSLVYGADVGLSYITNWTDVFVKYATRVVDGTWQPEIYSTSFADGGSLFMDKYSYKVEDSIQLKVSEMIEKLKNDSYQPFRCDPLYLNLEVPIENGNCVNDTYFKTSKILIQNSEVQDYGVYTIPIKFVDYPSSLKLGVTIVSAISIAFCIVAMGLVMLFRHAKIIRSASPAFCLLILLGCIVIFCACIIFSQTPTKETCRTRVWLLSIGFTIFLGNLLVKNWRIWLLFDNPKLKKRAITNWKLYPWVAGILAIDILILGLWTGLGNIRSEPRAGIDGLSKYEYSDVCTNDKSGDTMLYILLVFHGLNLLMACFISFKIKAVDIDEFNESKPISTSVYLITFCLFIVIPLMISPQSISSQTTIICVCSIFVTLLSIVILFGSKFYKMATKGLALNETFATSTKSSSFSLSLEKEEKDEHVKEEIKKSQASSNQATSGNHVSRLAYFTSDDSDDDESPKQNERPQENIDIEKSNTNLIVQQQPELHDSQPTQSSEIKEDL